MPPISGKSWPAAGFRDILLSRQPQFFSGEEMAANDEKSPFNPASEKIGPFTKKNGDDFLHAVKTRSVTGIFKTVGSLMFPLITGERSSTTAALEKGMAGSPLRGYLSMPPLCRRGKT
jgi:hypothetical protein